MEVICIDASRGKKTGCTPRFKEGETLNVKQSIRFKDSYNVQEYLFCNCENCGGSIKAWPKSRFIPTSSIDETETETYKNLQTQTI